MSRTIITKKDVKESSDADTFIEKGLTHPQIHLDYYEWLRNLNDFDRNFLATATPNGIAMWAWSRSRETLRERCKQLSNG